MSEINTHALTPQELKDEEMINAAFQKLVDTYLASSHRRKVDIITKAFNFAKQAHKGVRRLSGEPYILHPIAVAQVVCEEIGLGSTSICAALLHDVEEDTDYTNEDLSNLFGPKVANIVEGLTKISGGIFGDRASMQAETFKKLLLTMSDDVRVILIKIADRVHNMRTLSSMLPSKQYKIAGETLYIFAPLADRLGLNKIKTELENLSFKYEHPEEYAQIEEKLAATQPERDNIFENFTAPIREKLDAMGTKYTIKARVKSPYSIWKKMQAKQIPFEEVYDLLACRIIYTPKDRSLEEEECFAIYGSLTKLYTPHPTRQRDWVSSPKANGYQALHNTFMSKQGGSGKWIEVQIRSDRMDDIAEQGFAAHWKYKDANAEYDEKELDRWLNSIKEILDDPQPDTLDLLDTIKLNLFTSEVLVFTPKGELKSMPAGSTALDFAFSIHSFLGSHCFGAKVNHKLVPLSYKLKSGDQVEIITSRTQHVRPEWLTFATTAKAKGKIEAILRRENREKSHKGEEQLKAFFAEKGLEYTIPTVDRLVNYYNQHKREELFLSIGEGKIALDDTLINFIKGKKGSSWKNFIPFIGKKDEKVEVNIDTDFTKNINRKKTLVLNEEVLEKCQIAECCKPIPGDDVMGYINNRGELEIHARSCEHATKQKTRFGNNIIATKWDTHKVRLFKACIGIRGVDSHGVLYAIADVLHKLKQFVINRITLDTNDGIFEGKIDLQVYDTDDIKLLCDALRQIENVTKVTRIDSAHQLS
ncbi:MAG: bifunctional (p)ppGpp synthetase/guanosine-3',5'-bis(diphosphate) 3'-pyrophosphohydrolase [Bacteroidaceae bacterium]|nr:bifunctional (p)ppGpp synthetase/guanosine-3',5'-bis(diphosphate) 3'-pyrophosphohydrolase [Bacteroidaceae bacterium]